MRRIKSLAITALSLACVIFFNSCSSQHQIDSVLDAVPDSARFIALIDMQKLGNEVSEFIPAELAEPLGVLKAADNGCLDFAELAVFKTAKGYTVGALKVNDSSRLKELLDNDAKAEAAFGDFQVYTLGARKIVFDDSRCYISPDTQTIKKITKEKQPEISAIVGVRNFLNNSYEAITSASIASDSYGKKLEGQWLCRALHFTESSVSLDFSLMSPDGKSGEIGALLAEPVDPDVLGFIPDGCSLVGATGKQQEGAKMFGIESILRSYIPLELNLSDSGTTAWYARPAGSLDSDDLLDPRDWNFVSLSQASQTEGNQLLDGFLEEYGQNARRDPSTDCYTGKYNGMDFTVGYIQGYAIMGINGEIEYGNSNSYAPDFEGARMIVIVDAPKDSRIQKAAGLPCGTSLTVKATTDNLHAKLRFFGNSASPFATINEIPTLRNILPLLLDLQ